MTSRFQTQARKQATPDSAGRRTVRLAHASDASLSIERTSPDANSSASLS